MSTPSVSGLMARVLLALAPGAALLVLAHGPGLLWRLGFAVGLALAFEAAALRLRKRPLRAFLGDGSAVLAAVLLTLWLPDLGGWQQAMTVFITIIAAKQAFGGLGANPFNPAMAGAAFAQLAFAAPSAATTGPDLIGAAWTLGGLLLCALRIVRWQAPAGLLAGIALATLASGGDPASILSSPWLLAAFFIVSDPVSGCEHGRARLLFAFATGALAASASTAGHADALPFAILAMNALAPALDTWLAPVRRART